jgi:thiol-disulfide isomerase/thioredoxin
MRRASLLGIFLLGLNAAAQSPPSRLWSELKAQRESLAGIHQEFEVSSVQENGRDRQTRHWVLAVDMSGGRWRETSISGFNEPIRLFDGKDVLSFEDGEKDYVRVKGGTKDNLPMPAPYQFDQLDWNRAAERQRLPCGIQKDDHPCVVLEIPIKNWIRLGSGAGSPMTRMVDGMVQVTLDTQTGLLMRSRTVQLIEGGRCSCRSDITYSAKSVSYGAVLEDSLFALPPNNILRVKELPRWNAVRIKKDLAGKLAPELSGTDLEGNPVSIAALRGKTVLLDFWASWCPPCRQDAPALQKLHQRYGGKELAIIGISVSEERKIVDKFLKDHPAGYPTVLSTESSLPRPYQVGAIPMYIIIDENGMVQAAAQGDQGFRDLRNMLKKAGLDTD